MTPRSFRAALLAMALGSFLSMPGSALACATCFGASDSPMAKGMNMGILTLLLVVVGVLGALAAFLVFLVRRSALCPMPATPASHPAPIAEPTLS